MQQRYRKASHNRVEDIDGYICAESYRLVDAMFVEFSILSKTNSSIEGMLSVRAIYFENDLHGRSHIILEKTRINQIDLSNYLQMLDDAQTFLNYCQENKTTVTQAVKIAMRLFGDSDVKR